MQFHWICVIHTFCHYTVCLNTASTTSRHIHGHCVDRDCRGLDVADVVFTFGIPVIIACDMRNAKTKRSGYGTVLDKMSS